MIEVRVEGIEAALGKLNIPLYELAQEIDYAIAEEAVLPRLREYPPQSGKKQPFVSAKQRRYFFAALRKGKIAVPYQRSNKLRDSWQRKPSSLFSQSVTSSVGHAGLVVGGDDKQASYHQGNWWTVDSVAAAVEHEEAQGIAERVTQDFIGKSGAGP